MLVQAARTLYRYTYRRFVCRGHVLLWLISTGDETQPVCRNCVRLSRNCEWGLKLSYHASRNSQLSPSDREILQKVEAGRSSPCSIEVSSMHSSCHHAIMTDQVEAVFLISFSLDRTYEYRSDESSSSMRLAVSRTVLLQAMAVILVHITTTISC